MRFVFWQQTNSPHQFALLDALSRHAGGHTVELVVTQPLTDERVRMGWQEPHYEHVTVHRQPSAALIDLLIRTRLQDSVHIFSGLAADHTGKVALDACIERRARVGLMAEAADWNGHDFRRYFRLAKHVLLQLKYSKSISFILAIGDLGRQWYQRVGYAPEKIHSFGYYVDRSTLNVDDDGSPPHVLFIGRAVAYKGGALLLRALGQIKHRPWSATLVTEGEERGKWEALVLAEDMGERVQFANFESASSLDRRLAQATVLVSPNTADEGWGVIVNEALLQGTPVICSVWTGAKDLIGDGRGRVIYPNVVALAGALQQAIDAGPPTPDLRSSTSRWAQENINGAAAARRLVSVALAAQQQIHEH